ncbi:wall-associated receptor kinase 2-like [Solanum verrucosum]|uniref:wall-associated receptor kinase 2-like n=1 Tax=Solanum verrucosum TaxID=315347 RepID=UPI0020D1F1A3|nr:wall-associated receptor kinase 2-like [Solanum verrucosum]
MAFLAFMLLVLPMLAMSIENTNMMSNNIAKPGCQTKCGSLTVPYPLYCQIRIRNVLASKCYEENGELSAQQLVFLNTGVSFFTLSENDNKLILIGCDDLAMVFGFSLYEGKNFSTGCMTTCSRGQDVSNNGTCSRIGCCQAAIPKGLTTYLGFVNSPGNHTNVWSFNPCSYAFLGDHEKFTFRGTSDFMDPNFVDRIVNDVPIVIDWVIETKNCSVVRNSTTYSCMEHSLCINSESGRGGYRCICEEGYDGNPYLSPGCQSLCDHLIKKLKLLERVKHISMNVQRDLVMEFAKTLQEGLSVRARRDILAMERRDVVARRSMISPS